jgi:hypothetical protein
MQRVAQPKERLAMSERMLYEFPIKGATYYDGRSHQIVQSDCTLTDERLIIKDLRGRTQQIVLRDISDITPHLGLQKYLALHMGSSAAMHIYGKKAQLLEIVDMLNKAIASQLA